MQSHLRTVGLHGVKIIVMEVLHVNPILSCVCSVKGLSFQINGTGKKKKDMKVKRKTF